MRVSRMVATTAAIGALAIGLSAGGAAAADGRTPLSGDARAAKCAQLQERIAQTPGVQARIQAHIDEIQATLARIKDPQRRAEASARLQPRIDRLETLSTRLAQQTTLAQRLCAARRT